MMILVRGVPASGGKVKGKVCVLDKNTKSKNQINYGDIMVVPFLSPLDLSYILKAGAIVTDYGGITSHGATVARELGIPCIVATKNATKILKNRMEVTVDGEKGWVCQ